MCVFQWSRFAILVVMLRVLRSFASPALNQGNGMCNSKEDGTVYAIVNRQNAYIYCQKQKELELVCAEGFVLNSKTMNCTVNNKSDFIEHSETLLPKAWGFKRTCVSDDESYENQAMCAGQPFGALVPYPNNCNQFLVCNCIFPTVMTCPAGLWFNNNSKQCDYRQNVECERNTVTTTTPSISISTNTPSTELSTISSDSTETTSTDDITEESTGSSTGQSTVPTNICSGLSDGSLLPFTQNCFQYIECQSENIVLCKCPNDLLFDPKLLICSDPETVQCLSEDPTTTETTISSSTPDTSSICQDKELGSTMPYVEDCQWYYYCWGDGSFSLFPCPLYNWYNPHTGSCGYGSPTICQESTTTSQTISTTTTIQSTTTDEGEQNQCEDQQFGVTFPLPTNCQQYILCMGDGQSAVVNCIYYSWYDPLTGECGQNVSPTACSITPTTTAAPEITTTLSPDQICKNQLLGKTYPLPSNCEKYILCMGNGMSAIANCIYNSWYDPKTGECGMYVEPTACQERQHRQHTQ